MPRLTGRRITFVSTYAPDHCGIASYTKYLAQALLVEDIGVHLAVVTRSGASARRDGGLEIIPYRPTGHDYTTAVMRAVAQTCPDVVHIQHEYGIFGADDRFPRLLSGLTQLGCPVVVTMHTVHTNLSVDLGCGWTQGFSLQGLSIEPYQRMIGEQASLIIVHHDRSIRHTLIRQGLAGHKLLTIPHGSLHIHRQAAIEGATDSIPAGRPLLVAPGYFRRSKNADVIIEAFATIADGRPDAILWIGAYVRHASAEALCNVDACMERAAKAGVIDKVILAREPISESAMSGILASADVVLCVYDEDTRSASGILHRALGAGATVVASLRPKFQELAEVCDELLVDPDRPAELARLVSRLLDDEAFRRAVRSPLRGLALRTAWPMVARAHLDAYAGLGVGQGDRGSALGITASRRQPRTVPAEHNEQLLV